MEQTQLDASVRTTRGNGPARVLRRDKKIPAIMYGPGSESVMLAIDYHEFELALKKVKIGQSIVRLNVKNGRTETRTVMIKEVQKNPLSRKMLHVDFLEIDMDRKIRVRVPVVPSGKAKGVEFGGMLQVIRRELEVDCLPSLIPDEIRLDVSDLDVGDSIHVKDIELADGIEIPAEVNFTVLTVLGKKAEILEGEEGEEEKPAEAAE